MRIRRGLLIALALAARGGSVMGLVTLGPTAAVAHGAARPSLTAIVGVDVIAMGEVPLLRHQTVLIEGESIVATGAVPEVHVPAAAQTIDGAGRYLIPGLADFHTHVTQPDDLLPYIAGGVTTILNMGGTDRLRHWREQVDAGNRVGPQMLLSRFVDGPGGRGGVVDTVGEARAVVQHAAATGYDYIKVYNSLSTEQFDAIAQEAAATGLTVIGHGVREPGLEHILRNGMRLVAHGEEYIYTYFGNRIDDERIAGAVAMTLEAGAYVLPNLSAYETISLQWGNPAQVDRFLEQPAARYLHPGVRRIWLGRRYAGRRGSIEPRLQFLRRLTLALARAGVPLVAGTDSPTIPGMFADTSIHAELRNLVLAGLTPLQALTAATRTAGEFVRATRPERQPFGRIAPGYRADLVLLRKNPLERVAHARSIEGVMLAGRWLPTRRISDLLDQMVAGW